MISTSEIDDDELSPEQFLKKTKKRLHEVEKTLTNKEEFGNIMCAVLENQVPVQSRFTDIIGERLLIKAIKSIWVWAVATIGLLAMSILSAYIQHKLFNP